MSNSLGSTYFATVRREPLLVSYWRLNDAQGSLDAIDYGSRFDLTGVFATTQHLGPVMVMNDSGAGSSVFGAGSSNFQITNTSPLQIAGDISIEAWIAPYTESQTSFIAGKMNAGMSIAGSYYLGLSNGQIQFSLGNGTTQKSLVAGTPPPSIPSHVVATSFRGMMTIYLDGAPVAIGFLGGQTLADAAQSFYVGAVGSSLPFNGLIGEVALYNGALSARRVGRHYEIGQQVLSDPAHYSTVDPPVVLP